MVRGDTPQAEPYKLPALHLEWKTQQIKIWKSYFTKLQNQWYLKERVIAENVEQKLDQLQDHVKSALLKQHWSSVFWVFYLLKAQRMHAVIQRTHRLKNIIWTRFQSPAEMYKKTKNRTFFNEPEMILAQKPQRANRVPPLAHKNDAAFFHLTTNRKTYYDTNQREKEDVPKLIHKFRKNISGNG